MLAGSLLVGCSGNAIVDENNPEQNTVDTQAETAGPALDIHKKEVFASVPGYKIFFIADSHISMCDDRDAELMEIAANRSNSFTVEGAPPQDTFDRLIKEASDSDADLVIFGGDIIDSAMYASVEHVEQKLKELNKPYIYFMGNHDFQYGNEYFTPMAYEEYLPRLGEVHGGKSYQIKEEEELIIFAADDNNNQISSEALEAFKETIKKGKPIVLALHVPLEPQGEDDSFLEECKTVWGPSADGKSKVTMGINGVYPNEITKEFINLVYDKESKVQLVLAGHVHFYHNDMLTEYTEQVVTGAAFDGDAVEVTLKWPER